jgi:hypothetical protein
VVKIIDTLVERGDGGKEVLASGYLCFIYMVRWSRWVVCSLLISGLFCWGYGSALL